MHANFTQLRQNANEYVVDLGIKLFVSAILDQAKGLFVVHGFAIDTLVDQGVVDIQNGDDACRLGDLFIADSAWIALAVPVFVMCDGDFACGDEQGQVRMDRDPGESIPLVEGQLALN